MSNIIYKAKNCLTGQIYVGITTKTLQERIEDHYQKSDTLTGHKFQEAIRTYGPDAFSWEVIDTAENTNELDQKEVNYIYIYNSKEEGYNSDRGGGIKKNVYQYELGTGNLLYAYSDLESAGSAVSADRKSISKACLGEIKNCKGYFWSYSLANNFKPEADRRIKQVFQFEISGKYVTEYISVAKASEATGINRSSIAKCCRGEYRVAGNFVWKYSG